MFFAVAFDPATFYGHHEYDLAIAAMFGGFNKAFYSEYHKYIPQQPGFNKRQDLYKLFHNINHWLVFLFFLPIQLMIYMNILINIYFHYTGITLELATVIQV
jgi:hypothetical protein